jgi:hypothetical protein
MMPICRWWRARAGGPAGEPAPPDWRLDLAAGGGDHPRTRLIILNTPNNPTGTVLDRATLEGIGALAAAQPAGAGRRGVGGDLADGSAPSRCWMCQPCADRRLKSARRARSSRSPGGRSAGRWPRPRWPKIAAQHQFITFTTATPLQWAVAEGLALGEPWRAAHRERYAASRARLAGGLESAGFAVLPGRAPGL